MEASVVVSSWEGTSYAMHAVRVAHTLTHNTREWSKTAFYYRSMRADSVRPHAPVHAHAPHSCNLYITLPANVVLTHSFPNQTLASTENMEKSRDLAFIIFTSGFHLMYWISVVIEFLNI